MKTMVTGNPWDDRCTTRGSVDITTGPVGPLHVAPGVLPPLPSGVPSVGLVLVAVAGEVDLFTGPRLREVLTQLLDPPTSIDGSAAAPAAWGVAEVRGVVVDLTAVTFVDSHALGVLVLGGKLARRKGRGYALVATSEHIATLFEVTGLSRVLPLHPDVAAAAAAVATSPWLHR